ncbi:MAG: MFS transporter, partial [Silvibacterium sp.]
MENARSLWQAVDSALLQTVLVGAVNLLFTAIAMATVDRLGRKPPLIGCSLGMAIRLIAMGRAAMHANTGMWQFVFVLGYIAGFALSVGPVTWTVLTEIFPISVRSRALALATMALWVSNFSVSQAFPML